MTIEGTQLLTAWETMVTIRGFETRAEELFYAGDVRGSTHLAIGQEAVAVGARMGTEPGDPVVPTYRGHHYALAWGIPLEAAFGELLGRQTGCNQGRGGSKHFADAALGILPGNAIVAAGLPIACGTALRARLDGERQVTVVPFGDGATNQAVYHEALNLAAIWKLPVVFLCENNLYSEMTPIAGMVAAPLADRAAAMGLPARVVDGMDVQAMAEAVAWAAERGRSGEGPSFIEAETYRFCGHMPGDSEVYRSKEEVGEWRERDPIPSTRGRLSNLGMDEESLRAIEQQVDRAIAGAEAAARAAPLPDAADIHLGAAPWMEVAR